MPLLMGAIITVLAILGGSSGADRPVDDVIPDRAAQNTLWCRVVFDHGDSDGHWFPHLCQILGRTSHYFGTFVPKTEDACRGKEH